MADRAVALASHKLPLRVPQGSILRTAHQHVARAFEAVHHFLLAANMWMVFTNLIIDQTLNCRQNSL